MKIMFVVKDIDYIDPIGLMQLSALARQAGHTTQLGILAREDVLATVEKEKPDVIGYSAPTGEHKYYLRFNQVLKTRFKNIFTIMGGPHPTFFPEVMSEGALDAICVGEGEGAFMEVLERVASGQSVTGIQNIVPAGEQGTTLRHLVKDLDSLPFPDRELFYSKTEMRAFGLKSFMASRGCPYPCTYCFNHAFRKMYAGKGKIMRRHSVDYIIEQVAQVKARYPLSCVKFYDDIFVYRVDAWLEEFARKYKARIGLPFHCLTRADLVTEDMVKLLKEAGCYSLSMSIEAGNERLRNDLLKRGMTDKQLLDAFDLVHKHGINTFANSILGLPLSTLEDDIETLDFNLKCRVSFAEFPIFHPYPRTELGDLCIEQGLLAADYDDFHMSYMDKSPLSAFSDADRNAQRNLSALGPMVVWFPRLRNLVANHLIHWPYNRLFLLAYYIAKAYLVTTRIYPLSTSLRELPRMMVKSLKLETFKKTDETFHYAEALEH